MSHLITKTHLPLFLNNQFIPMFTVYVFGCLLTTNSKTSPIMVSFSLSLLFLYSYFIHVGFHNLPNTMNIHLTHHHNNHDEHNKSSLCRVTGWMLEFTTNVLFFALFYWFQILVNVHVVPDVLIFYYGFIYVTIHNINYSLFHSATEHVLHHTTTDSTSTTCNYGPDLVDHLFRTKYNNKTFENYNHITPNILVSFLVTSCFFNR